MLVYVENLTIKAEDLFDVQDKKQITENTVVSHRVLAFIEKTSFLRGNFDLFDLI